MSSPRRTIPVALLPLLLAGCLHGKSLPVEVRAQSLGNPGLVLSRALTRVQVLGYTVDTIDAEGSRFSATHSGSSFASLFGSDSNCEIEVATTPAARPETSEVLINWQARNAGSLAGCRKDAESVLRYATGEQRPPILDPDPPPPIDPQKVLHGGIYGN
ncbi:MAG: hypothetical protein Q8R92_14810 [Deltaproteobacteria bacterium]|nr:hypothetical protein [Deltaproteobacteria bacterium]